MTLRSQNLFSDKAGLVDFSGCLSYTLKALKLIGGYPDSGHLMHQARLCRPASFQYRLHL